MTFKLSLLFASAAFASRCYDHLGFTVYRALADDTFLTPTLSQKSPAALRFGAACFEAAKTHIQNGARRNILAKGAHGNFSPKPLGKLFRLARQSAPLVLAVEWSSPAVMITGGVVAGIVMSSMSHFGHGDLWAVQSASADLMANWLGSNMPTNRKTAPIPAPPLMLP